MTDDRKSAWRNIAIYVFFVAVVVATITVYQFRTNHRLEQTDKDSCMASRTLIVNQRLVLSIIDRNTAELSATASSPRQGAYYRRSLKLIHQAQARLDRTPNCE